MTGNGTTASSRQQKGETGKGRWARWCGPISTGRSSVYIESLLAIAPRRRSGIPSAMPNTLPHRCAGRKATGWSIFLRGQDGSRTLFSQRGADVEASGRRQARRRRDLHCDCPRAHPLGCAAGELILELAWPVGPRPPRLAPALEACAAGEAAAPKVHPKVAPQARSPLPSFEPRWRRWAARHPRAPPPASTSPQGWPRADAPRRRGRHRQAAPSLRFFPQTLTTQKSMFCGPYLLRRRTNAIDGWIPRGNDGHSVKIDVCGVGVFFCCLTCTVTGGLRGRPFFRW